MKFSIKNENGQLLKYIYKDRAVFNGESPRDRKVLIYTFSKAITAAGMITKLENTLGLKNLIVAELEETYVDNEQSSLISENVKINKKRENSTFEELYDIETINTKCLGCNHSCKQSPKATVMFCPLFS